MTPLPYDCVIAVAGLSSRMGRFKPLVSYRGLPLLLHAVNVARAACRRVIVVTGYRGTEVREALAAAAGRAAGGAAGAQPRGVEVVNNEEYRTGMVSSIACGAAAVESEWYFVVPGDMPELTVDVFVRLAERVAPTEGAEPVAGDATVPAWADGEEQAFPAAIFPSLGGRRGHPVLISRRVIPALQETYRSVSSMRAFLNAYPVEEVVLPDEAPFHGIHIDVDTAEELTAGGSAPIENRQNDARRDRD